MDFAQIVSLILLVLILVLAMWRNINIGLLGFGAAALLVVVSPLHEVNNEMVRLLNAKALFSHFPGSIFTLLVGVSLLFAHLEKSGGLNWFANKVFKAIGDRTNFIPWVGFFLGTVITSIGAFSTATIALLVPVIAALCRRHPKIFFTSEMAAIIGANGAALSPINPVGIVVSKAANNASVTFNGWEVWFLGVLVSMATVMVIQFLFRSSRLIDDTLPNASVKRGFIMMRPAESEQEDSLGLRPLYAMCSFFGVVAFVILVVFAKADVGLTAISLSVFLMLLFPGNSKNFARKIPWGAIIVLCGLLMFIGAMQELQTMKVVEEGLISMTSSHIILLFLVAYLTTFLSNVEASTMGVISLMAPMVMTIFGASPHISLIIAAIMVPPTLSVVNPIHAAGTLVIGFTEERQQNTLFRRLITIAGCTVIFVPGLVCILPAFMI